MRYKTFAIRSIITGETISIPFEPAHYRQAGLPYSPAAGLPVLEAFQLINEWNTSQNAQKFVYGLLKEDKP